MRPGRCPPRRSAGRARLPQHRTAPSALSASAEGTGPAGDRRGRFRPGRRHRYATIITDAETGRRVAALPDREAATLESWLREHPGIDVVCRDGSATYAEAIRRALPDAKQVSDRWHLWRNLCAKVQLEVRAHAGCWVTINPPRPG